MIYVAGLLAPGLLIQGNAITAFQTNEIKKTHFYAGIADIRVNKNYLIIVGDTQGTSHWEFWRERNDRE